MKRVLLHLAFWIALFFIWERLSYFYISNVQNRLWFSFIDIVSLIFSFYLVYLVIAPRFFFRKNKYLFVILFVSAVMISGFIMTLFMKQSLRMQLVTIKFNFYWNYKDLVFNRYFIVALGATAGLIAKFSFDWLKNKRRIDRLEKANTEAELNVLKAQINPHFLFNSLNSIFVQMDVSNEKAKQSLHTFSQLLRYQLYDCVADKVLLDKEIQYLDSYIELQKTRLEDNVAVEFDATNKNKDAVIAPLLLISFIENAFKYVSDFTDKRNIIRVTLRAEMNTLIFSVYNTTDGHSPAGSSKGIGLENTKRRLELIYPDKHTLSIKETGEEYSVNLKVELQ